MLLCPIKQKEWFLILPYPEGGTITGPRYHLNEKILMSLEGILIGSK
jgi:hypothetical protein